MPAEPRATRRRVIPDENDLTLAPAPEPAPALPVLGLRPREISVSHMAIVDSWFANGCLSKRKALDAHGIKGPPGMIFSRPEVADYIHYCLEKRQTYMAMTEADIIREYEKIAKASFGDILEVQEDGTAWVDMASLTPDMRAAISEYHVEAYTETRYDEGDAVQVPVKKFRVKFHDKKAALDSLARIHGMNKDRVEVAGASNLIDQVNAARKRLQQKEPTDG